MQSTQNRRRFLATLSSAGAAGLIGAPALAQQAPPETTTIRLIKNAGICVAPQYVADELLRAEEHVPRLAESGLLTRDETALRRVPILTKISVSRSANHEKNSTRP